MFETERNENMDLSYFSLQGERAFITGGGSGIGLGIARCMLRAGAEVVLTGRRKKLLDEAVKELGAGACALQGDVTDFEAVDALARRAEEEFGPVSIVVNNAGIHLKAPFEETSMDDFDRVMRTHVGGAFAVSRAFVPGMRVRGRGHLLFIASMTTFIGMPQVIAYSAAKSAFGGMVRALTADLAPSGIRVNAVAPGWIDTPMLHKAVDHDPERKAKILGRTPMKRFGSVDDIGNAAVFLSSAAASFITGVILPVDGGAVTGF
jgi:gluconate 5-dehydrogenase